MRWIKTHKIAVLVIVLMVIAIPLVLEELIFDNSIPSKVSNDGWAGFFGGYLGAIIGAIATIVAIRFEIDYNEKRRIHDEIKNVRPYLCIQEYTYITHGSAIADIRLSIQNVGFYAACDIYLQTNNPDDKQRKTLYAKHLTLGANMQNTIPVTVNLSESERYRFFYFDIRGDSYTQELIIEAAKEKNVWRVMACNTLEPKLYRDREEYESIGFKEPLSKKTVPAETKEV